MRLTPRHAVLALALAALPQIACTPVPTVPTAGTTVDSTFWKDYHPTLKKGMKWTYAETYVEGGTTTTGETTNEVTEVQGDVATFKITGHNAMTPDFALDLTSTQSVTFSGTFNGLPAVYKSEGAVDVTVPFKTFQGAAKVNLVTPNAAQKMYFYFAPGVGMIKLEITNTASGSTTSYTQELKNFVSP
ncbi:MAG TPA: hypothetical protein V6D05_13370 [Stenomitos sp.]